MESRVSYYNSRWLLLGTIHQKAGVLFHSFPISCRRMRERRLHTRPHPAHRHSRRHLEPPWSTANRHHSSSARGTTRQAQTVCGSPPPSVKHSPATQSRATGEYSWVNITLKLLLLENTRKYFGKTSFDSPCTPIYTWNQERGIHLTSSDLREYEVVVFVLCG